MVNPPTAIAPPCNQGSVTSPNPAPVGNILRTCGVALGTTPTPSNSPTSTGASPTPSLISQIDAEWKRRITGLYSGSQTDETGNTYKIETPSCSVTANQFDSGSKEISTNHLGQTCGNPVHIQVNASSGGVSSEIQISPSAGTLETAYYRGLKVQIAAYELAQVKKEITSLSMTVSPACQCASSYYQQLIQSPTTVQTVAKVQPYISALSNASLVWLCDPSVFGPNAPDPANLPTHVSQSMQQFCSARVNLEAMYAQLAVCEIQERTTHEFNTIISKPADIIDGIANDLTPQLQNQCSSTCNSCNSYDCCSNNLTSCVNQLYPTSLANHFAKLAQPYATGGK